MKSSLLAKGLLIGVLTVGVSAQEPPWDPARVQPCDRACLVAIMDRYLDALVKQDRTGLPLEPETRITENTATVNIGEGILWKARNRADPVQDSRCRSGVRPGRPADCPEH